MYSEKIMSIGLFANRKTVDSIQRIKKIGRSTRYSLQKRDSLRLLFFLRCALSLSGCGDKPAKPVKPLSQLQRVKQSGELKIVTQYSLSSYYGERGVSEEEEMRKVALAPGKAKADRSS